MIDWNSDSSYVLLNPRVDSKKIEKPLLDIGLRGHLWIGTSGTEGKKWVALSKKALLISAAAVNKHLNATSSDIWLHVLPDFHVGGVGIYARAHLAGSNVIKLSDWSVDEFLKHASTATLSALIPTQVHDLVKARAVAPTSMRAIVVGGGKLHSKLYDRAKSLGWNLLPSYGLTECCSQVATATETSDKTQILSHVECALFEGKLRIKSPALLTAYATFDPKLQLIDPKVDGWFQTEDYALLENGSLSVLGRGCDYVKVSGEGVSLVELDAKLYSVTDAECALCAIEDERLGYVIALAVIDGFEYTSIVSKFQKLVAPYERIKKVFVVDEIPKTTLGKLCRSKLSEQSVE